MENLVASVHGLSRGEDNAEELQQLRKLLNAHRELVQASRAAIDEVLDADIIRPADHTLAYAYFLHVKAEQPVTDVDIFARQTEILIAEGNKEQIQLAGRTFVEVCNSYAVALRDSGQAKRGIIPLTRAATVLRDGKEYVTGVHSQLLMLCLESHCHRMAVTLLSEEVYNVNSDHVTPEEFMLFGYYGGLVWLGLRRYREAMELFEMAICTPALVLSKIVVESMHKHILTSLLVVGKHEIPRHMRGHTRRQYLAHSRANALYDEFSRVYDTLDSNELLAFIGRNEEALRSDGNYGLAMQCVKSAGERKILALTKCFVTLSLSDIAKSVGLEKSFQAEAIVLRMIEEGKIHASISKADGMVTFLDDPENYDSDHMRELLDLHIRRSMALSKKLQDVQESVESTRAFAIYASRQQRASELTSGWGAEIEQMYEGINAS